MKFKQLSILVTGIIAVIVLVAAMTWSIFNFVFLNTCGPIDLYEKPLSYTWNVDKSRIRLNSYQPSQWYESTEENGKELSLITRNGMQIYAIERGMDQYVAGGVKWSDTTVDKIEKRMREKNLEDINVASTCYQGKKAFKVSYKDGPILLGEHYYIKIDDNRALLLIKMTYYGSENEQDEKEWELVYNSVELK